VDECESLVDGARRDERATGQLGITGGGRGGAPGVSQALRRHRARAVIGLEPMCRHCAAVTGPLGSLASLEVDVEALQGFLKPFVDIVPGL